MKRIIALSFCVLMGCGAKVPPLSSESKAMIRKFDDQFSKHKTATFEQLCKEVDKLHSSNKISDQEFEALHGVCGPASTGQWDRAKPNLDLLLKALDEQK
jgi:hypothetical protein